MQFKNIPGQDEVKRRLLDSVKMGRVSHAQLFFGPEGAGKLQLTIAYAQYICCLDQQADDSCGECISCVKFTKLNHPDVHFAFPSVTEASTKDTTKFNPKAPLRDPEKNIPPNIKFRKTLAEHPFMNLEFWLSELETGSKQAIINTEDAAEIIKTLSLSSYESEYKFMIIWHAEKMNASASNKLLKIIEEPPDKTIFLLATEQPDDLLKTIQSRLQMVKVPKIKSPDMRKIFEHKLPEKLGMEAFIRMADGNFNKAISLSGDEVQDEFFFVKFQEWMRLCVRIQVEKTLGFVEEMARIPKEDLKGFLLYGQEFLRQCMIKYNKLDSMLTLGEKELAFMEKFSPFIINHLDLLLEEMDKAYYHIERNANSKILLFDLTLRLYLNIGSKQ